MKERNRVKNPMFFDVEDVMLILGIKNTKAYDIIKELRKELVSKGYAEYPAGRIPKKYFCERYYLDLQDVEEMLRFNSEE